MYAIIEACGRQYKVKEGDIIFFDRLENDEGTKITFDNVLLISENGKTKIGEPTIKGAKVEGIVIGHGKDKKILVFRYKAKKNYKKTKGHRQCYTKVQIEKITTKAEKAKVEVKA